MLKAKMIVGSEKRRKRRERDRAYREANPEIHEIRLACRRAKRRETIDAGHLGIPLEEYQKACRDPYIAAVIAAVDPSEWEMWDVSIPRIQ